MFATIDDITLDYEEDGQQVVKELDKVVLSKGAWTTILFRFQQLDPKLGDFGPERYSIRRYKKVSGVFKPQSKFVISSAKQARQIVDALSGWLADSGE